MRALFTIAVLASAACGGGAGEDRPAIVPQPLLSDIQDKILTPSCAAFSACHNPSGKAGHCDLTPGKTYAAIVNHTSSTNDSRVLVVPGKPEESFLIAKLRAELGSEDGDPMPLRNPSLDEAQIQAIEAWIAAGAVDN